MESNCTDMVDGIKIAFYDNELAMRLVAMGIDVVPILAKSRQRKIAKYRHLTFRLFSNGYVEVDGSLHKYFKGENYSDFGMNELIACIDEFCAIFKVDTHAAMIKNIEFGVNITTPFNAYEFCSNLLAYGNKRFMPFNNGSKAKNIGFYVERQRYKLKCYDKMKQYGMSDKQILRIEVAVRKMRHVESAGIKTLEDLKNINKIKKLSKQLLIVYGDVMMKDLIDITKMSKAELKVYNSCIYGEIWESLTCQNRCRLKKKFYLIVNKYGQTKIKDLVQKMLEMKILKMLTN